MAPIPPHTVSRPGWHQCTFKVVPIPEAQPHTPVHPQQSWLGLAASHSKSQTQLPVYPQQSQQSLVHSQPGTRPPPPPPPHQGIHGSSGQVLQPADLGANPTHQHTHSNCGPTTTEGCTQPMRGIPLRHLDLMTRGYCASGSQRPPFQDQDI